MRDHRLVAALACRNNSTRLYGKPLQLLDIKKKITVLDHIIILLKKLKIFDDITLGIANSKDNIIYETIARKHKISFIYGPEDNVIKRLILCAKKNNIKLIELRWKAWDGLPISFLETINRYYSISKREKLLFWKRFKNENIYLDILKEKKMNYKLLANSALSAPKRILN